MWKGVPKSSGYVGGVIADNTFGFQASSHGINQSKTLGGAFYWIIMSKVLRANTQKGC